MIEALSFPIIVVLFFIAKGFYKKWKRVRRYGRPPYYPKRGIPTCSSLWYRYCEDPNTWGSDEFAKALEKKGLIKIIPPLDKSDWFTYYDWTQKGKALRSAASISPLLILLMLGCGGETSQLAANAVSGRQYTHAEAAEIAKDAGLNCANHPLIHNWKTELPKDVFKITEDCVIESYVCGSIAIFDPAEQNKIGFTQVRVYSNSANAPKSCMPPAVYRCAYNTVNVALDVLKFDCRAK